MRLQYAIFLAIFATSCMAQPNESSPLDDELKCNNISTSPQLDDCVNKEVITSNAHLRNELASFNNRVKQAYLADTKLGEELISKVHESQDAWLTFRTLTCGIDAFEIEKGTPAYITTVKNCIIRMNGERINYLKMLPH